MRVEVLLSPFGNETGKQYRLINIQILLFTLRNFVFAYSTSGACLVLLIIYFPLTIEGQFYEHGITASNIFHV